MERRQLSWQRRAAQELGWGGIVWSGEGIEEMGTRAGTVEVLVRGDPRYFLPAEVETLLGKPSKAHRKLGWTPTTTLGELVVEMVRHEVEEAKKEAYLLHVVGSMENPPSSARVASTGVSTRP